MSDNKEKRKSKNTRLDRIVGRATQFYKTYTTGLKSGDFRKLFTEETKGIYKRFDTNKNKSEKSSSFKEAMRTVGRIFWGFVLALSPARRILYGLAFLIFLVSAFVIITAPYEAQIRQDMTTVSIYSFIIVSFLLALELADKLSARDEIEIAREVQLSLLPPENPELPGLKVASFSSPATDVGGDYYDFASVNGRTCLAIGDVSGHGLASGLVMAMAKSAWQAQLINDTNPAKVLSTLNRIVKDAGGSRTFMTFIHGVFEDENQRLVFSNAGHIYPLHIRNNGNEVNWVETTPSYPLGIKGHQKYENNSVQLEPGDVLLFISDGAVEAMNDRGESYGYTRFIESAERHKDNKPEKLLEGLLDDLQSFVKNETREDDLTIIVTAYHS